MINTVVKHGYLFSPIASEPEKCKKVQKSAITIQKTWRGFKIRKQFSRPPKSGLNPIGGAIPVGNDPISHLERYITVKKHPAIMDWWCPVSIQCHQYDKKRGWAAWKKT